jgi:hypothetical protein
MGINILNPADQQLLLSPISSPDVIARFPWLANPNNVYPGFPANQPLRQALRPPPEFFGVPPYLGPPMGDTWYDVLQTKITQRLTHGLSIQGPWHQRSQLVLHSGHTANQRCVQSRH